MAEPKSLTNTKDLLIELVKTDFKLRYNGSFLGFLWVLLKPFLLFLVLFLVFSYLFHTERNYGLSLLAGLLIFYYFSEATNRGLTTMLDKANIILKVNFRREVAVLAPTINAAINFAIGVVIFFIFWLFHPQPIHLSSLFALYYILLLTILVLGFSFFASILYVQFRDLLSIWEVLLQVIFYITPIIYPLGLLPSFVQRYIFANPLSIIVEGAKAALFGQAAPSVAHVVYVSVFCVGFFVCGYFFFKKRIRKIAEFF